MDLRKEDVLYVARMKMLYIYIGNEEVEGAIF
jgi:hypothetical protein